MHSQYQDKGCCRSQEAADHDAKQTGEESAVGRLQLMKQPLLHSEQQEPLQQSIPPEASAL